MNIFKSVNRQILFSIFFMIFVIIGGTLGYAYFENYSMADGFYMTIITITTVGYGEIQPLSTGGRMFTSILILFGFVSIALVGRTLAENFFSRIISSNPEKKKMLKEIGQLDSHYIICGFGRVGNAVAEKLKTFGTKIVVIESEPESCEKLREDKFLFIEGNAINDRNLLNAGIKKAVGLLAILPSIADNLFITLTARELNPTLHIIARADNAQSEKRLLQAGADIVISPYTSAGHRIAKMMLAASGKFENENQSEGLTQAMPRWIEIEQESNLVGLSVDDLLKQKGFKVLGLRRSGKDYLDPENKLKIESEDTLYIVEQSGFTARKKIRHRKSSPSVLIVDDNPAIVKLYVRLFRRADFIPMTAVTGEEALKIIEEKSPNAAVLDLHLPGYSGIDLCKTVRHEYQNDNIKLILFTSDDDKKMMEKAVKVGANAVVVKSSDASELIDTVINLLRQN